MWLFCLLVLMKLLVVLQLNTSGSCWLEVRMFVVPIGSNKNCTCIFTSKLLVGGLFKNFFLYWKDFQFPFKKFLSFCLLVSLGFMLICSPTHLLILVLNFPQWVCARISYCFFKTLLHCSSVHWQSIMWYAQSSSVLSWSNLYLLQRDASLIRVEGYTHLWSKGNYLQYS